MIDACMDKTNKSNTTRGWSTYWDGARDAEAYASGGVSHPMVASFWDATLSEFLATHVNAKILDIATGSGAIIERLSEQPDASLKNVTCVDIAESAIQSVNCRFPDVVGVVADAKSIPLESSQYDLVTSQFGIEYAGLVALDEAVRLLAPDGSLVMLIHIQSGVIFSECATALDAIERTLKSEFIPHSLQLFETGFAAIGGAERASYDQAALQLNPAIQELESVLAEYGKQVAGDTIVRLYSDVQQIHSRMQYYEPDDVLGWLRTMDNELSEYAERMASMCEAAIDESTFDEVCENLRGQGFNIVKGEPLFSAGDKLPFAWILRARRSN
jgi:ubiquinone/menaquinone biosynthesis C-methylase UbiE